MHISFLLPTVIVLLLIIRQDLSSRSVSWPLFPLLAVLGIALSWLELRSAAAILKNIGLNAGFLLLQFGLLRLWFRMRTGKGAIIDHAIGKGDLFFLLDACCFFSPLNFILFYLLSLLISLLLHFVLRSRPAFYGYQGNVPLAGLQAGCLLLALAVCAIGSIPLTDELWKPLNL